jgi:hypothetical protein
MNHFLSFPIHLIPTENLNQRCWNPILCLMFPDLYLHYCLRLILYRYRKFPNQTLKFRFLKFRFRNYRRLPM